MALTLIPRHIRALSDQLNAYYRVLKGTDPDSLAVRLPGGGSFQVRHSATAAPVLLVTDAGIDGSDIMAASIPSSALITGVAITNESITNAHIQDATVRTQELAPNAVSQTYRAAINTGAMGVGGPFDVPGSGIFVAVAAGEACLFGFEGTIACQTPGAVVGVNYVITTTAVAGASPVTTTPLHQGQIIAFSDIIVGTGASGQHKLQYSSNSGTVTLTGRMHVLVMKR